MTQLTRERVIDIMGHLPDERIAEILEVGGTPAELIEARQRVLSDDTFDSQPHGRVIPLCQVLRSWQPEEEED